MSEEISMNQKVINVELLAVGEESDILRFKFDDYSKDVNLNSPLCQNELREVFVCLLHVLMERYVHLELCYADDYNRGLYKEVCEEYINDLNRELESAKEIISKELE